MYRSNAWKKYEKDVSPVMKFAEGYKEFLSFAKTERLATKKAVELLKAKGFEDLTNKESLKAATFLFLFTK